MIRPRMIAMSLMAMFFAFLASEQPGYVQPIEPDVHEAVSWDATPSGVVFVFLEDGNSVSFAHAVVGYEPNPQCNEIRKDGNKIILSTGGANAWRYLIDPVPMLIRKTDDWKSPTDRGEE